MLVKGATDVFDTILCKPVNVHEYNTRNAPMQHIYVNFRATNRIQNCHCGVHIWNYSLNNINLKSVIGNRVNLHLFLTILQCWGNHDFIKIKWLCWVQAAIHPSIGHMGLLCGSVALLYTWNLLTFSPPVLRGGTVHGLCHSSSYV